MFTSQIKYALVLFSNRVQFTILNYNFFTVTENVAKLDCTLDIAIKLKKKTKLPQFKPYQKASLHLNHSYNATKVETVDSATLLGIEIESVGIRIF